MPENRDLDRPDPSEVTPLDEDEEVIGTGEGNEEFEDDEDDDLEVDDEAIDDEPRGMAPTDEVGSEGGSEGNSIGRSRSRIGGAGGTEATETWRPGDRDRMRVDHRGREGVPGRRSPS